jgi:Phage integrase family
MLLLSEMLLKLARRAGLHRIPVRSHVIRHRIATAAAQLGATVHELADMLNHSDMNTVKRYVHGTTQDAALTKVRALLAAPQAPPLDPMAILEGRVTPCRRPCNRRNPVWTLGRTAPP